MSPQTRQVDRDNGGRQVHRMACQALQVSLLFRVTAAPSGAALARQEEKALISDRIHEFNVETTLQVFLPYHESPNFARMLAILTIPQTSPWFAAFHPLIKNAQPVPRSYIATAISPAKEPSLRLLSSVVGSVQVAMKEQTVHRALLALWTSTIVEMLERSAAATGPAEGFVKLLVEAFVEILSATGGQDVSVSRHDDQTSSSFG